MRLNLNFKPKLFYIAVALFSISILASSCIKSSGNSPISAGPGGGSDGGGSGSGSGSASGSGSGSASGSGSVVPPPPPPTPNTLNPTVSQTAKCSDASLSFCETEELANSDTFQIKLEVVGSGTVGFTPPTLSGEQKTAGFTLTPDATTCSSTLSSSAPQCTLTLTYLPTSATLATSFTLNYSYTNSKGSQQLSQKVTYQAISLLTRTPPFVFPTGLDFTQLNQLSFSGSTPSFWLTNTFNFVQNNTPPVEPTTIATNIAKYEQFSFPDTETKGIVLTSTAVPSAITLFNMSTSTQTPLTGISNYAFDNSFIYGATFVNGSCNGCIYKIDALNTQTTLTTLPSKYPPYVLYTLTDKTQPIIYTLSTDIQSQETLCSFNSTSPDLATPPVCFSTPVAALAYNPMQNQIAADGTIYIQSFNGTNIKIVGYKTTLDSNLRVTNITATPFTDIPAKATGKVSMSYDTKNKIIYALFSFPATDTANAYFNLIAFDATTGAPKWTAKDASGSPIAFANVSQPFMTPNGNNVLVVASDSKVYGFKKDGTAAFTSGYTYSLPVNSSPALNLITMNSDLNALNIPTQTTETGTTTTNMNSLNMSW